MNIYSTTEDVNGNNNFISNIVSSVSENVQECRDEEARNRKDDENVEKYAVFDTVSQDREEDCNREECSEKHKLKANERSSKINVITIHENVNEMRMTMENENDNIIAHNNEDVSNLNINERSLSKKFLDLIDEDSDEEIISCKKNCKTDKTRKIINSESEEDLQTNDVEDVLQTIHKTVDNATSTYQTLLDSDSEEDEKEASGNSFSFDNADIRRNKNVKQNSVKKKKGSIRASKEEAMHKIYSESQRLLRETDISLPYHRPKQRTLQEFLNRKKISAALPKASSTAAKLKMSSTIVSRVLAEKEKEAEHFYKSSDSEDDTQQLVSFGSNNIEKSSAVDEKVPSTNIEFMCVQDSKKIGVSNQKSCIDFDLSGISEIVGKNLGKGNKDVLSLIENSVKRDNGSNMLLTREITNKSMQNTQSVSRRSFENSEDSSANQVSDVIHDQQETAEEIVEVSSGNDGESINKGEKSKVNETDDVISQWCDDSDVINNLKTPDNTNNKETAETLGNDEDVANFDGRIVAEDGNSRSEEKRNETYNVSSIDARSEIPANFSVENRGNNDCVFGLPLPELTDDVSTGEKRFLLESSSNSEVRLKGLPGMIINLTEDTKSSGRNVNTLLERFFSKHSVNTKKQPDLSKSKVSVIHLEDTPNGPIPVKETLPYKMPVDSNNPELCKPGAKLTRLKEDLKLQMITKRNTEWKQREMEQRREWDEEDGLSRDSPDEQKQLDLTVDSDSDGESEPEENDVCIRDKKRHVYLFADDEAEVTDDEDSQEMYAESDAEDSNEQFASFERRRRGSDKEEEEDDECNSKKDEDSSVAAHYAKRRDHSRDITPENETPVYQQRARCETPLAKTSMLDFISPVTQLSVFNTIVDSVSKKDVAGYPASSRETEHGTNDISSFVVSARSNGSQMNGALAKKRLFDDTEETVDEEYLMRLCSGKFGSTQSTASDLNDLSSQLVKTRSENETSSLQDETRVDEDSEDNGSVKRTEVEPHKKKQLTLVVSSDDEDCHSADDAGIFLKPKKRPLRRLTLTDSEEEEEEEENGESSSDEESSDIAGKRYVDYDSEENEVTVAKEDMRKVAARFVEHEAELSESDWDSADEDERGLDKLDLEEGDNEQLDEHEIRDQLGRMRAKQMLDEDKRDVRLLKELLFEDGDLYTDGTGRERKFKWRNVDKLESNTETSRLLDEQDNNWIDEQDHEEEAEWHRLRQEREKFLDERTKNSRNELEDELCDSQIFKPFKRTNESQGASPDQASDPSETMEPIMPRNLTDLLNGPNVGKKSQMIYNITKKSSFLSRGEESLARIASLAKQGDSASHAVNKRNFVFQYIGTSTNSTSREDTAEEVDLKNEFRKRKTTSNFSSALKKRRR